MHIEHKKHNRIRQFSVANHCQQSVLKCRLEGLRASCISPLPDQIAKSLGKVGEFELETFGCKSAGDYIPPVESQVGISLKKLRGGEADEPGGGGKADGDAEGVAQGTHEGALRNRLGR